MSPSAIADAPVENTLCPEATNPGDAGRTPTPTALSGVRVACFYPWSPFESSGAWTRFSCLWRSLFDRGATVTLAFLENGQDVEFSQFAVRYLGEPTVFHNMPVVARHVLAARPELRQFDPTELNFLLRYDPSLYLNSPKMAGFLEGVIGSHDIVTCEYPLLAPVLSQFCRKAGKRLIVTSHDLLYEAHGCHPRGKEKLKQCEVDAMRLADALVFCNDAERLEFEQLGLNGYTVLNTGDVFQVVPGNEVASRERVRGALKIRTAHYCLFVGTRHGPNLEGVAELRKLARMMPDMTFVVAGNCAAAGAEGNLVSLGFISDQMLDVLYRGAFAVLVPLTRGTGTSVKTFQAMTYGKAIISTSAGARGLDLEDGKELLIVGGTEQFPRAIRRLLAAEETRETLGVKARQRAEELDYRRHFEPYAQIIRTFVRPPASSPVKAPSRTSGLVVIDNTLTDRVGHHFNYTLSLKNECERRGTPFHALVNQGAADDICRELSARGVFARGIHQAADNPYPADWGNLRTTYDFLSANDVFARELAAGLQGLATVNDVVFLPNATPRQILGLAALIATKPAYRLLRYNVLLRYSTYIGFGPIHDRKVTQDKVNAEWYELSLQRLIAADTGGVVKLSSDSVGLAEEFSAMAKRPVSVLPIPHTHDQPPAVPPAGMPAKPAGRTRIVFLGDARDEKGFELLPAVVRACAADKSVEIVIQGYVSSHYHYRMMSVIEELSRLKLPNLHLLDRSLSGAEYQWLLQSSDIVLLPYDCGTYRARTSGPFVEAICAGKTVIVPEGSWMSGQLGKSGAGVTFKSGNVQDLVRATTHLLANRKEFAAAATALGAQFREFHNPQMFVTQLIGT